MRTLFCSITCICIMLALSLMGCQTDRTFTMFGFSREISDSTTDPERLNRELEYDLREKELQRVDKLQTVPKPEPKEMGNSQ